MSDKVKTVDEEITNRAAANLEAKLMRFKAKISEAIIELDPNLSGMFGPYACNRGQLLLSGLASQQWPEDLLAKERNLELAKLFEAIDKAKATQ